MKKPVEPSDGVPAVQVLLSPANVWRAGLAMAAVAAVALFLRFMITDAGPLIAMMVMAWFLSLAMEPAVRRLSRRMPRGRAALLVMTVSILAFVVFLILFGSLFVQQVAVLLKALPGVVTSAVDWLNARFGTRYEISDILESMLLSLIDTFATSQELQEARAVGPAPPADGHGSSPPK